MSGKPGIIVQAPTETSLAYRGDESDDDIEFTERRRTYRTNSTSSRSFLTAKSGQRLPSLRSRSPVSPESRSPQMSKSLFKEAAKDEDFEAIKEGLSFALGNSDETPHWFPVQSKPERNSGDFGVDEYPDSIPLDSLNPDDRRREPPAMDRRPSHLSRLSPYSFRRTDQTSENWSMKSPGLLETGIPPPSPGDGPLKFPNVLTRISDRIAGTGVAALPATEHPPENPLTKSVSEFSSLSPSPSSDNDREYFNQSPLRDRSTNPVTIVTDEYDQTVDTTTADKTVSDGLGLYLTNNSTRSVHTPDPTPSQPPIIHNLKHTPKANRKTMYLFGRSLKIFGPESELRQWCYRIVSHHTTNLFLLSLLVLQVILLSYRQWNPRKLRGYFTDGNNWADYILILINVLYTAEVFFKIIAFGFIDDRSMFTELGLKYPESDVKKFYFSDNAIVKLGKKWGLDRIFFKPQQRSYNEVKESMNPFSDIQEPEPKLSPQNIQRKYSATALLKQPVILSQRFDVSNTFFLLSDSDRQLGELQLRRAYIRNSWHRIDFLSMVMFWISLFLSIDHYDAKHHIMLFRALSCLRILRLCNLTAGTTTILTACKVAIPQLIDVAIFISCFWLFFGILGVQSFKSSLSRHCVWTNPDDSNDTFTNSDQYCGSFIGLNNQPMSYITRDGESSGTIKGYRCPKYSQCISGDNPYGGTVNFDNILQSLEMVFVVMSANTFTDIMYYTMDSDNMAACLFFIFGIFILTVWLMNVFIAVIVSSFNITRMEADEKKRKRGNQSRLFRFFRFSNTEASMENERINALKRKNVWLRYYYKFDFIFVFLVMMDLFTQCFRNKDMSDYRAHILYRFESVFTGVFGLEILLRLFCHLPDWRAFFTSRRNCVDLLLAVITVVIIINPVKEALGHAYYWLTVFQIMRFYRVVLATGITRNLWLKMMRNFKALFDLAFFFFILLFLVSIILARYFEGVVPPEDFDDVDFPMHTLPNTFIALYVITSTENWSEILYDLQQYAKTTSSRSFGSIFLIAWFILSNSVVLNIFIAVIAKTLEVSEEGKRKQQLLQFIDDMTVKLQNLDTESGLLAKMKKKVFGQKGVKEDLEKAVVNLLLSGTAVNDFLEEDIDESGDESVKKLPTTWWKRWFQVNFWRTNNFLKNPFYLTKANKHEVSNFDPANFARNIITERNLLISKQNKFLKENPRFNDVFYLLKPRHRLRRFCQRIVPSSHGERVDGVVPNKKVSEAMTIVFFLATIALVITACYITPLYRKQVNAEYGEKNWTFYIEVAFTILFTIEFFIKIVADGLLFTPNAYLRSSWNFIDLCVLISLWIELLAFLRNDGNLSRIVRGLKALRALRLLTISDTAKNNFHNTIISGFWKIINAAIISLCLLFPFSIWGLNIFNGRLGYCLDGESNMDSCYNEYSATVFNWGVVSPNVYTGPQLEFNRFPTAFATLFEIVSLEGWADLLLDVMSSTGIGTPPQSYATPINGFFVILFNFISTVFILTLFVSVIISNYLKTTGRAYMTQDQISWYQVKKFLVQVRPSRRKDLSQLSSLPKFCYRMTVEKNEYWYVLLNISLIAHVLALLIECFPTLNYLDTARAVVFMISATVFLVNAIMLLIGQGFKTFILFKWNVFSFVISFGAFMTTIVAFFIESGSVFININKLFLVAILAFVIPRSNRLSQLLRFASASLPSIISLSFTWIVIFLVFAIAMNQIFGLTKIGPNGTGNLNFRSVPKALIVLFRCSFGEGWNYIMKDFTLEAPFCSSANSLDDSDCGNMQYSYILFIAWNIISMYILLNMFISLILDNFSYVNNTSHYSNLIKREEVRKFKRTWQRFDPMGTGFIKPIELPELLHSLEGAFSYHFYHGDLEIKSLCEKWFTRNDPNDPYDVTVRYSAIEETLNAMDIPKIRERRKLYERFMEEAIMSMEINNDPGISFTRILLQIPLYTHFEAGQCLNLIDFLERRLLLQKVQRRLDTKRVFETIAAYACRWKYKKDQLHGVKDDNLDFGKELRRQSYFANENLGANAPSIYVNDQYSSYDDEKNPLTVSTFDDAEVSTSGIYVPKSPVPVYKARNRGQHQTEPETKGETPKLYIQIPSSSSRSTSPGSPNLNAAKDDIILSANASPFLDSNEIHSNEASLIDLLTLGETLENSSWGEALREVHSDHRSEERSKKE